MNIHPFKGADVPATKWDANDYQTFESTRKVMIIKGLDIGHGECRDSRREMNRQKVVFRWTLEVVRS